MKGTGILLVNLGSPDTPSTADVRRYLGEFLMDERVIDMPRLLRAAIVHGFILPFRPKQSAHAYQQVWTAEGSPLVAMGRHVQAALRDRLGAPVELSMRYGNPSIRSALERLEANDVDQILCFPLFPHYAMSSYETAVERVKAELTASGINLPLKFVPPYFAHPAYIEALVESSSKYLARDYDHLLVSFHGLPERHLRKTDPTNSHCLGSPDCCDQPSEVHATCYRAQCYKTARQFAAAAGIPASKYSVAFQSRLGSDKWMGPATAEQLTRLAASGVTRLAVMCPAFVADCLESLEEMGIRGREAFLSAGGTEFTLIPCLNDHPRWIAAMERIASDALVGDADKLVTIAQRR